LSRSIALALLALLILAALPAQPSGQSAADAISRLNSPRSESTFGNGVDTATGLFSLDATPLSVQGGRALDFSLYYDAFLPVPGGMNSVLGPGWTHIFEARLEGTPGSTVTVYWDNNRRNTFFFDGAGYQGLDESVRYARLEQSGMTWRLIAQSGTTYRFNMDGQLTEIENKVRQGLSIQRDMMGRITSIEEDITGKVVSLNYSAFGRLQYLSDPGDRIAFFEYFNNGYLSAIHSPASLTTDAGEAFVPIPIPDGIANPFHKFQES